MSYLKCKSCGICYKLKHGEFPGDFESCSCGGELEFYDNHGRKRSYKNINIYSKGRRKTKTNIILIFMVLGLFILYFLAIPLILNVLEFIGPSNGTYFFVIFFFTCFVTILSLLWYLFRRN